MENLEEKEKEEKEENEIMKKRGEIKSKNKVKKYDKNKLKMKIV